MSSEWVASYLPKLGTTIVYSGFLHQTFEGCQELTAQVSRIPINKMFYPNLPGQCAVDSKIDWIWKDDKKCENEYK